MTDSAEAAPALLVVDDNDDNRYTLTQRLKRQATTTSPLPRTAAKRWRC